MTDKPEIDFAAAAVRDALPKESDKLASVLASIKSPELAATIMRALTAPRAP